MQHIIHSCDGCGTREIKPVSVNVPVGTQVDSGSARTETRHQRIDLCPKCAERALDLFLDPLEPKQGRDWLKEHASKIPTYLAPQRES